MSSLPTGTGPVRLQERALAPDLARGAMLALIALVNSTIYLHARPYGLKQHIVEDGLLDRITSALVVVFADGRAYPMFAALFAAGAVQVLQRSGPRVLRRRCWWMLAFGLVHAVLLFPGDVLGLYGVVGFAIAASTRIRERTLLIAAACWLVVVAVVQGAVNAMPPAGDHRSYFWSFAVESPLEAFALRPLEWLMTPFGMLGVVSAALVGICIGRRGLLTDPARYRTALVRTAVGGLSAAVLGGLPMGLAVGGFWAPPNLAVTWAASAVHVVTGVAGGLGYAALIGLLAIRLDDRRGPVVRAISACGQRSLSCYLFQSAVFVALLMPFTLGLGATLGSAEVALLALGTWLVSVLLAEILRRAGKPGPAETLLRHLTRRNLPDSAA
ncbi:DUF418 domain-containing protein [Saccharopolyspora hirsuta]|uniref:DUF418 domain-containing protein n=1 Tax=Saccharopolyspora hirsuta TaxID=1837 RepID=A0A5M7BCC7_SACHI|nr:DUF418 domain-containing protein [Saccharopolyspora hirsuta]KAA5827089.1 DUF418 domain-containing protein [Saccharopolyspora hirsuta]